MSDFSAAKEGHYERLWRDEAEAGKTVRDQRDQAMADARRWKQIAVYLADICAATAQHDLMLKGTSASRRNQHAETCRKLLGLLEGTEHVPNLAHYRDETSSYVRARLQGVVNQQKKETL